LALLSLNRSLEDWHLPGVMLALDQGDGVFTGWDAGVGVL
jgi:hypothetical protein